MHINLCKIKRNSSGGERQVIMQDYGNIIKLLSPISEQLIRLEKANSLMPTELQEPKDFCDSICHVNLSRLSLYPQPSSFFTLCVKKNTIEESFLYNEFLLKNQLKEANIEYSGYNFPIGADCLKPDENTEIYTKGVNVMAVDAIGPWDPGKMTSSSKTRLIAKKENWKLSMFEILSFLALNPGLIQALARNKWSPSRYYLGGLCQNIDLTPFIYFDRQSNRLYFGASDSEEYRDDSSSPFVLKL